MNLFSVHQRRNPKQLITATNNHQNLELFKADMKSGYQPNLSHPIPICANINPENNKFKEEEEDERKYLASICMSKNCTPTFVAVT